MSANVFMIIIPNQKKVVADAARRAKRRTRRSASSAKQRSMHNNYLTLPVLFLMLSNHYPLAFGTQFNWIIVALVLVMGVTDPPFLQHGTMRGKGYPWWTWAVTAILFIIVMWLSQAGPADRPQPEALVPAQQSSSQIAEFPGGARHRGQAAARCAMRPSRSGKASCACTQGRDARQ